MWRYVEINNDKKKGEKHYAKPDEQVDKWRNPELIPYFLKEEGIHQTICSPLEKKKQNEEVEYERK